MRVTTVIAKLRFISNLCDRSGLTPEAGAWAKHELGELREIQWAVKGIESKGESQLNERQSSKLNMVNAAAMEWLGSDRLDELFNILFLFDEFLSRSFDLLHRDWPHTVNALEIKNGHEWISKNETFLYPEVTDEMNNWTTRGFYVKAYRDLEEKWSAD